MQIEGIVTREIESYDGTRILYQKVGEGPVIVLANGLGGTFQAWYYLIEHLRKHYTVLSWDYRGLYGSGRPEMSRLTMADHILDLRTILEAEGIDKILLAGWSMGTQFTYEYALQYPEQVVGLVPICGAAGAPFETALYTSLSRYTMPALFRLQRRLHHIASGLIKLSVKIPGGFDLITASGLFWRGGSEVIRTLVDAYAELDFEVYAQIMLNLGLHDARYQLHRITQPVLMIAATRDFFTPVPTAKKAADTLPDAELHVVAGGTHYLPLEKPEVINELIDGFIDRKVRWA